MEMSGNRNLFHTILLNGFLASIECEEFTNASYLNVSSKSISTMKMKPISELSICGRKVSLIASKVESRKARKRWRMLSVFLRCSAVINLPNTIEKRPIVEYLQTKKII